jgi:hypothetical protein
VQAAESGNFWGKTPNSNSSKFKETPRFKIQGSKGATHIIANSCLGNVIPRMNLEV